MTENKFARDYSISFHRVSNDDRDMLSQFECGNKVISNFIKNESLSTKEDVSYVFIDEKQKAIMAFCSIKCTGISVNAVDANNNEYITNIPSVEIDFFAVDEKYRSIKIDENSNRYETLSQFFFLYILETIKNISKNHVGATHVCLYAVPRAASFYKRCGFIPFEEYMFNDQHPFLKNCKPMFYVIDK